MRSAGIHRRWWFPALLVVLATGCGGDSSDTGDDVAVQYPNATEYQLELLEGGVTWAEYEKAAIDMVACMKDHGVAASGPSRSGNAVSIDVAFPRGASEAEVERVEAISAECEEEYFDVVSSVWNMSVMPTEEELAERERNRRACARELGFDTPDDMPNDEFYRIVFDHYDALVPGCVDKYP
jgi:hypothetical protein